METSAERASPRPFLKWAGGKQALAPALVARFPGRFERYFEPFLGGGSVLLTLRPRSGVASDGNAWLVDTYRAVRDDPCAVGAVLEGLVNSKEEFLRIRAIPPPALDPIRRAAHLIYLNKTCFRGLFRVNRAGRFNVPYGAYERRYFCPENLAAVRGALLDVELRCGDFEQGVEGISRGDFAYLDPPYYKVGGYSDFNRYTAGQFRQGDHERLAALCRDLDRAGVRWAVSNSDTQYVRRLYRGFRLQVLDARREINLDARRRGIRELLLTNY